MIMERKWLILSSICLLSFFQYGSLKALEISVPRLIEQLEMSAMSAGLTCSIAAALATILGPLWAAVAHLSSDRIVTVIGSILMALGLIFVSVSTMPVFVYISMIVLGTGRGLPMVAKVTIIKQHFQKDFNVANGVASAGGSLGLFLIPPFVEILVYKYGWRGALMIFGAMCFNSGFAGYLMKDCANDDTDQSEPHSKEMEEMSTNNGDKYKQITSNTADQEANAESSVANTSAQDVETLSTENADISVKAKLWNLFGFTALSKKPIFIFDLIAFTLLDTALYGWIIFLFTFLTSSGLGFFTASTVSSCGGAGSLFGRMLFGPLLDGKIKRLKKLSPRVLIAVSAFVGGMTLFLYPYVSTYASWTVLAFFTGIFTGTTTPVYTALIDQMFTKKCDFGAAVGLHYMVRGIGMLCGGPLTGLIYDKTGSFDHAFVLLATFQFTGGVLICVELCLKKILYRREHNRHLYVEAAEDDNVHTYVEKPRA